MARRAEVSEVGPGVTPVTYRDVPEDIHGYRPSSRGVHIAGDVAPRHAVTRRFGTLAQQTGVDDKGDEGMSKRSEYLGRGGAS